MGTMVSRPLHFSFDPGCMVCLTRTVNAELRQPKSERGTPPRTRFVSLALTHPLDGRLLDETMYGSLTRGDTQTVMTLAPPWPPP